MDLKRIDELSAGIDDYLKQLSDFTSELREIKNVLGQLRNSQERNQNYEVYKMRRQMEALTEILRQQGIILPNEYEVELDSIRKLMVSNNWPLAVPENRICNTETKQKERAKSIIDIFVSEYLKGKRFLDFGCGMGHTVEVALSNEASFAIGYDIKIQWEDGSKCTNNWDEIIENSPYDVIVLYDVLDHIELYDPIEALKKIKNVMSPNGQLYVRNHPWSSRHGGHVYLHKNLAFLHLVLDDVELTRVGGLEADYNVKVLTPLETYRYWFEQAEFRIESEMPIKSPVEEFFMNTGPVFARLMKHWNKDQNAFNYMEIDFVDYILSSNISDHQIL